MDFGVREVAVAPVGQLADRAVRPGREFDLCRPPFPEIHGEPPGVIFHGGSAVAGDYLGLGFADLERVPGHRGEGKGEREVEEREVADGGHCSGEKQVADQVWNGFAAGAPAGVAANGKGH